MLKINPLKLLLAFKIVSILYNEIKDINNDDSNQFTFAQKFERKYKKCQNA